MRVLGLDPGLRHTGWGVIDVAGNRLVHVADGVVHAAADQPLAMRLVSLFRQITAVVERFRPEPIGYLAFSGYAEATTIVIRDRQAWQSAWSRRGRHLNCHLRIGRGNGRRRNRGRQRWRR